MSRDPLPTGHLELMLLSLIARRPSHGYAVIDELRGLTGGALDLPEGSVYPVLYRLERQGFIESSEQIVDGRRRRIYRITRPGRTMHRDRSAEWRRFVQKVDAVLRGVPHHA
jgi:DNA-binding PadR family transcriptional regulator